MSTAAGPGTPGPAARQDGAVDQRSPLDVVADLLRVVRSGADPDRAADLMAPEVLAHQGDSGVVVRRTPADYADHVREMLAEHGPWEFTVTRLAPDGHDAVAAQWRQVGRLDPGTGRRVVEHGRARYTVRDGRVTEYVIAFDHVVEG